MESDSDHSDICTPPEILKAAQKTSVGLLPEKSKEKYEGVYKAFMDWRLRKNINSFSENVLLAYFAELEKKYKSSSLWAQYSMLRSTLNLNHNIGIQHYGKLRAFLKRKSEGYKPKKTKTFTADEIKKFMNEASNNKYLDTKVVLIMGIMGACRANKMHAMTIENLQDLGTAIHVTIPNTKTKIVRTFTITGKYYQICKQYLDLCPTNNVPNFFFLNFQNGKCTRQKFGINKFSLMGRTITAFLNLPDSKLYTSHSFRRSSATLLVDASGDIITLKRHGGWKSTAVAEGYINNSFRNKMDTANKIYQSVNGIQATTSRTPLNTSSSVTNNCDIGAIPSLTITNCSNFTVTIVSNENNK